MKATGQPSPRAAVADRLHSGALHLVRTVRTHDASTGLTPARASALAVLVSGGSRTVGELAAVEGVQSPTMTQMVTHLEALGLVLRVPAADDRRRVVVEATEVGRRLLEEGRARRVALLDSLLDGLDETELEVLDRATAILEDVVARLRGGSDRPHLASGVEHDGARRR